MVTQGGPSTEVSRRELQDGGYDLVTALCTTGLVTSLGNARKLIDQGGAYVNNRRVDGDAPKITMSDLICDRYVVLRRGRREIHLITFV
jgi:tyrosyl-tRNA synthetase